MGLHLGVLHPVCEARELNIKMGIMKINSANVKWT